MLWKGDNLSERALLSLLVLDRKNKISNEKRNLMPSKFELKRGKGGYRFNLKAPNGQTILTSEQYASKSGAENGIRSVKENAKRKGQFEKRKAQNGQTYFVLKAKNGETIGRSETYKSLAGRKNGMDSVQRNAGSAKLEDKT
jgi:hypothetical protein